MPSRISGSRLPLVAHCRGAFTSEAQWPWNPPGPAAAFGSAFHKASEVWYEKGEVDLCAVATEFKLDEDELVRLERMFDGWASSRVAGLTGAVPEWGATLDTDTRKVILLPKGGGREAYNALPANAVPATLDLVRVEEETRTGEVHDWKTGRTVLPKAKDNWQLKFGALLLARSFDLESVRVYLHTLDEEGELRSSEGEFDSLELDGIETQVVAWAKEAKSGNVQLRPGGHCAGLFCPMRANCPATVEAERSLAPVPDDEPVVYPLTGEITSPEQARWILHRIDAVQAAVDLATKMVREYADAVGGIPAQGGKKWGCFVDEWLEPDLSHLTEQGGALLRTFGLDGLVTPKLAGTAIKQSMRERGLKGKSLDGEYGAVMAALEGAGLTKKKQRVVYTERKGEPKRLEDKGGEE